MVVQLDFKKHFACFTFLYLEPKQSLLLLKQSYCFSWPKILLFKTQRAKEIQQSHHLIYMYINLSLLDENIIGISPS